MCLCWNLVRRILHGDGDDTTSWQWNVENNCIPLLFVFLFRNKHISVPLSGSAKHMRPIIRSYVCVEVQNMCVSVELHMLFVSQSFTCLVQGCEIIETHRGQRLNCFWPVWIASEYYDRWKWGGFDVLAQIFQHGKGVGLVGGGSNLTLMCMYLRDVPWAFNLSGSCFSTVFFSLGIKSSCRDFAVLKVLFIFLWLHFDCKYLSLAMVYVW